MLVITPKDVCLFNNKGSGSTRPPLDSNYPERKDRLVKLWYIIDYQFERRIRV